jgi:hypothetical protein
MYGRQRDSKAIHNIVYICAGKIVVDDLGSSTCDMLFCCSTVGLLVGMCVLIQVL